METIVIDEVTYKIPDSITETNKFAKDVYGEMRLVEVLTGREDFDRIDNEGGDWFESQCFDVYGEHYGVNGDDVEISKVSESMFAWFSDYKGEDHMLCLLEKI